MRLTALVLLATAAVTALAQPATSDILTTVPTGANRIVRRWALPGDPRALAVGSDGTIYAGLAESQEVIAIDPKTGAIKKRLVLDSAEIASTKELVTMRTNPDRTRLFIANGSDESATILRLPDLAVLREITMEGETIRDVVPDPRGRHVYILGRRVHVFDGDGQTELRALKINDPMAIAVSSDGALLAVLATEDFGSTKATVAALYDTNTFTEITRDPLQTDKTIEAALFGDRDRSLLAIARDSIFEKRLTLRPTKIRENGTATTAMRVDIGELVNSAHVCLPEGSGPQVATLSTTDQLLVYAEQRCSASGTFSGSSRGVVPASLYNVNAYAIGYDKVGKRIIATDRAGFLTIYNMPRPAQNVSQ